MNAILAVYSVLGLMIMLLGFGSVVGAATGLPAGLAAAALMVLVLVVLGRGSLDATVASALVVGAIDIGLIGLITLAALPLVRGEYLASAAVGAGGTLDWAVVGFAVAVVLSSYFGHTSAANAAKIVLRRDPSGRSLLAGNAVAMVAAIGIYAVVAVAVIGAVGPSTLTGNRGTSLEILSEHLGPVVGLLGLVGALVVPLLGGVFPMLIVVASRRRGELLPARVIGWVGTPIVAIAVGLVYLGIVAAHGLVIFSSPLERAAAFAVVGAIVAVTALSIRNGALRPRAVVEVSVDEAATGRGSFSVLADGRPASVAVTIEGGRGPARSIEAAAGDIGQIGELRSITFAFPRLASELKLWLHGVTADRESVPLGVSATLDGDRRVALDHEGQASVPLTDEHTVLRIRA
jgi:hypothetical protein